MRKLLSSALIIMSIGAAIAVYAGPMISSPGGGGSTLDWASGVTLPRLAGVTDNVQSQLNVITGTSLGWTSGVTMPRLAGVTDTVQGQLNTLSANLFSWTSGVTTPRLADVTDYVQSQLNAITEDVNYITGTSNVAATTVTFQAKAGQELQIGHSVYIAGGDAAALPLVMEADNRSGVSARVVGIIVTGGTTNATVAVRRAGVVANVDTLGATAANPLNQTWAEGDLLFLCGTAGGLTNVRPTSGRMVKVAYSLKGSSNTDSLLAYPFENPVWVTAASGESVILRLGDEVGTNKVEVRDYANVAVASIDSNGMISAGTGSGVSLTAAGKVSGATVVIGTQEYSPVTVKRDGPAVTVSGSANYKDLAAFMDASGHGVVIGGNSTDGYAVIRSEYSDDSLAISTKSGGVNTIRVIIPATGGLNLGTNDSDPSGVTVYGGGAGEPGATITLYNGSDKDGTVEYYRMVADDNLWIGSSGTSNALVLTSANDLMVNSGSVVISGSTEYINFGAVTQGETGYGLRESLGKMQYKDSGGSWTSFSSSAAQSYVHLAEVLASATLTGTFNSGLWNTRTLNTEISDADGICALSGTSGFVLSAGTYIIEWTAPAYKVNRHQSRLKNQTSGTTILIGSGANAGSSDAVDNYSFGAGKFTIAAGQTLTIEHRAETTQASNGYGYESNFGEMFIVTQVRLWKVG